MIEYECSRIIRALRPIVFTFVLFILSNPANISVYDHSLPNNSGV